jgi:hypothetical protein
MVGIGPAECLVCKKEVGEWEIKGDIAFWNCKNCKCFYMAYIHLGKLEIVRIVEKEDFVIWVKVENIED